MNSLHHFTLTWNWNFSTNEQFMVQNVYCTSVCCLVVIVW